MSRKATTHDNIMIEIFFGRMKVEMFYGKERGFYAWNPKNSSMHSADRTGMTHPFMVKKPENEPEDKAEH